jgi:AraC-like DNA-binding protein
MHQTFLIRQTFTDVDDLALQARQWNLDFRQLDRGRFQGNLLQFGVGGVQVGEARFSRSVRQKGAPPDGMRTIAIPANRDLRLQWRGKAIDGQSLMVFPEGAEFSSVSGSDFHVYTCSFPNALLSTIGESLKVGDLKHLGDGIDAFRVERSTVEKLRGRLFSICNSVRNEPSALSHNGLSRQLTCDLPREVISAIAKSRSKCPFTTGRKRLAALARAEAYIETHARRAVRVTDLCEAAGVSERTLQYAFVQKFGIGPKEFLNVFRLISIRRQLQAADPRRTKVADVANSWGFWHMGQFAADYRQRFDEYPSETLNHKTLKRGAGPRDRSAVT